MVDPINKELAQQIVDTVKDICGQNVNFISPLGLIIASTDDKRIGSYHVGGKKAAKTGSTIEINAKEQSQDLQQGINLPIHYKNVVAAVIGITGPPDEVRKYAYLAEKITKMLIHEQELNKFSRTQTEQKHFILQTLISNETSHYDYVLELLTSFGISTNTQKRIIQLQMIRHGYVQDSASELKIRTFFENCNIKIYAYHYPNTYLALVDHDEFDQISHRLKHFSSAHHSEIRTAVGKSYPVLQLSKSYHTCSITLKSLDHHTENFAVFDELQLEIIISSVSSGNKKEFVDKTIGSLKESDLSLLTIYYDLDMSLSDTCSRLYLHKNTVQNKLNRIHRICGYNPRKFKDAAILYLALNMKASMDPH